MRGTVTAVLLAAALACAAVTGAADRVPERAVLFIGNSLTYSNDLPAMVGAVADAAGEPVRVGMVAGPNLAVIDHTTGATDAVDRIETGGWGYVVLQQGPTPAGICRDTLVLAAMRLGRPIRASGARAALFAPWTRRGAQRSLGAATVSAEAAAQAVGGVLLPVGA
ncbi:MAG TPA: hypothetical protein VFZ26_06035, partial [Gemmatimonadales bacterium]